MDSNPLPDQTPISPLLRGRLQQAREPLQRRGYSSAVSHGNEERVGRESNIDGVRYGYYFWHLRDCNSQHCSQTSFLMMARFDAFICVRPPLSFIVNVRESCLTRERGIRQLSRFGEMAPGVVSQRLPLSERIHCRPGTRVVVLETPGETTGAATSG